MSAAESMGEDVQEIVCRNIFQGKLSRKPLERNYSIFDYRENPAGIFYTELVRSPKMVKAAIVCKEWNKAYKRFLDVAMGAEIQEFFQNSLTFGWQMCDLDQYVQFELQNIRSATRQKHTLWLGSTYVVGVRLSRIRIDIDTQSHILVAQFHAAGQNNIDEDPDEDEWDELKPERVAAIPQVYWLDGDEITEDQREERSQFRMQENTAFVSFLNEQHAAATP